jgi:hypothetical protein
MVLLLIILWCSVLPQEFIFPACVTLLWLWWQLSQKQHGS